jgi:mono/diheme cytochrome c family protein
MSHPERRGSELSHAAQGAFVVLAIFFAAFMFAIGLYVGQNSEPEQAEGGGGTSPAMTETAGGEETETSETETTETETAETEAAETETEGGGGGAEGASIFASAGCANCHNLDEANATGSVGPDLDETGLDREGIEETIRNGRGAMPAFEGSLDDQQIEAVSDFVDSSKG